MPDVAGRGNGKKNYNKHIIIINNLLYILFHFNSETFGSFRHIYLKSIHIQK